MGLFIKNPNVERKARELARLEGKSLTAAIEAAIDQRLDEKRRETRRRPTVEEMLAATDEFRRRIGLDKVRPRPMTKADWDALWPTGLPEIDDA